MQYKVQKDTKRHERCTVSLSPTLSPTKWWKWKSTLNEKKLIVETSNFPLPWSSEEGYSYWPKISGLDWGIDEGNIPMFKNRKYESSIRGCPHFPACYGKFTSQSVAIVFGFGFVEGEWSLDFVQGSSTIEPPFGRICLTSSKHLKLPSNLCDLLSFQKKNASSHLPSLHLFFSRSVGRKNLLMDIWMDYCEFLGYDEREMTRTWRKKEKPGCFR